MELVIIAIVALIVIFGFRYLDNRNKRKSWESATRRAEEYMRRRGRELEK